MVLCYDSQGTITIKWPMDSIKKSDIYELPAGSKGYRITKREKVLEEITAESCFSISWKLETTDPRISVRYPKQDNDEAIHIYTKAYHVLTAFKTEMKFLRQLKKKTCITYRRMKIKTEYDSHKLCKLKDNGTS